MPEYTIVAAEHKKDMPAKEGFKPSQIISLVLSDGPNRHEAEWITSKDTDAASLVGQRKAFTLESSQYGIRAKADRPAFGGAPRARDPKETSAIVRQHSQTAVGNLLIAKATAGLLTADDLTPANLKRLHDWYDDDVTAGVERRYPQPGMVRGLPVRNEPERTGAPDVQVEPYAAPAPPDGSEPFAA